MTRFIADSSSDLLQIDGVDFKVAPLTVSTETMDFVDDENLDVAEMVETLASYKGKSFTACPSVEKWLSAYDGADVIYVSAMSSAISGTYNSALVAKDLYLQSHPEAKIHVFDTLSAGPEVRLLIEKLIELDQEGKSFEEVCECAEQYLKRTRLFFSLKSLHNLAQNGRVNKVVAAAAGALGISVMGRASEDGKLEPTTKCRGEKKVISTFLSDMIKAGYEGGKVRMLHVENVGLAEKIKQAILDKFPKADVLFYDAHGICSYYAEHGGILIGIETEA